MRPMRPRPKREERIQEAIRIRLLEAGWTLIEKTHGNVFQPGWPDLFCFKPFKGHFYLPYPHMALANDGIYRWVEVKRPTGKLTPRQVSRFRKWIDAGMGIWILTSSEEIGLLDGPPNVEEWLK